MKLTTSKTKVDRREVSVDMCTCDQDMAPGCPSLDGGQCDTRYGLTYTIERHARLIAAAPDLLYALKWAAEFISLNTDGGAGWTGVQQGPDRERFMPSDGNADYEAIREFIEQTIERATGGTY